MSYYKPDKWVILRISTKEETIDKVLASWSGGYTQGDSWKVSSGICKIEREEDNILFHNYSGSVYECSIHSEGLSSMSGSVLNSFVEQAAMVDGMSIQVIPFEDLKQ